MTSSKNISNPLERIVSSLLKPCAPAFITQPIKHKTNDTDMKKYIHNYKTGTTSYILSFIQDLQTVLCTPKTPGELVFYKENRKTDLVSDFRHPVFSPSSVKLENEVGDGAGS